MSDEDNQQTPNSGRIRISDLPEPAFFNPNLRDQVKYFLSNLIITLFLPLILAGMFLQNLLPYQQNGGEKSE
jgi:hypothetical protein